MGIYALGRDEGELKAHEGYSFGQEQASRRSTVRRGLLTYSSNSLPNNFYIAILSQSPCFFNVP
jgi:hypothetical protein